MSNLPMVVRTQWRVSGYIRALDIVDILKSHKIYYWYELKWNPMASMSYYEFNIECDPETIKALFWNDILEWHKKCDELKKIKEIGVADNGKTLQAM